MRKSKGIDWVSVEADYRAGILSNRQISKKYRVSESMVRKRAKAGNWVRTKQIGAHQPKQEIILPGQATKSRSGTAASNDETGDHLTLGRAIAMDLLRELDYACEHIDELEDIIEAETAGDKNGRRRQAMLKMVSAPGRALTLKTVTQALLNMAEADKGKKQKQVEAAAEVARSSSRFATPQAPKLAVDNTKKK